MTKKALLLCGTLGATKHKDKDRAWKIAYNHWMDNVIDKDTDIYFFLWDNSPETNWALNFYRPKRHVVSQQIHFEVNPQLLDNFIKHGNTQKKRSNSYYYNMAHKMYSRFWATKEAIKLKDKNIKYDWTILSRFDLCLKTKLKFDNLDEKAVNLALWEKYFCKNCGGEIKKHFIKAGHVPPKYIREIYNMVLDGYPFQKNEKFKGINDIIFVGKDLDHMGNIYDNINVYFEEMNGADIWVIYRYKG